MFFFLFLIGGCEPNSSQNDSGIGSDEGELGSVCDETSELSCVDELILDLSLQDDSFSDGSVSNTSADDGFVTLVDATAGGYNNAANNPWVYIQFTEEGARKLEIDDEEALTSMDWDMALRRYIIRLNGGNSGPSCVGAVTFFEQNFEDIDSIPEGLTFVQDTYYTQDCTIINDSSGLPNSPQVVLSSWWEYPGCVATTGYPHLIQLADGSVIKMVVDSYYGEGQDECNDSGQMGGDSAMITMRWKMLD